MNTPFQNACSNILELLLNLCGRDNDTYRKVLHWLAFPLQNEGEKLPTALLINNVEGCGKTLFFSHVMGQIYGSHYSTINQQWLDKNFNDWMSDKRFVVCEDVRINDSFLKFVKYLVTTTTLEINRKMWPVTYEQNKMNFVFTTSRNLPDLNNIHGRFMVLNPIDSEPTLFKKVRHEIDQGGTNAFHQYLLNIDLNNAEQSSNDHGIKIGSKVQFKRGGQTITGAVKHLLVDISNHRKQAVIAIDHELPGIEEMVPVDTLTPYPNFVFLSGEYHPLSLDSTDRRFFAIQNL